MYKMFRTRVFSRHPSHNVLRNHLVRLPTRSLIRLGSKTVLNDGRNRVELNSVESINISSNKLLMKRKFNEVEVPTAPWVYITTTIDDLFAELEYNEINFPIVAKSLYGSQGIGNYLIKTEDDLIAWMNGKDITRYIFEKYMSYQLEYRLHVTKHGCFYTCRKALKLDTNDKDKWRRHKDNSVWLLETNENFNKPDSWDDIIGSCVKALGIIGADILSFDVKVQKPLTTKGQKREYQNYILLECNSASSMSPTDNKEISICAERYLDVIPKLILEKVNSLE